MTVVRYQTPRLRDVIAVYVPHLQGADVEIPDDYHPPSGKTTGVRACGREGKSMTDNQHARSSGSSKCSIR